MKRHRQTYQARREGCRPGAGLTGVTAGVVLAAACAAGATTAFAQQSPNSAQGAPTLNAPFIPAPGDWTITIPSKPKKAVVPRKAPPKRKSTDTDAGKLSLVARLTEAGQRIEKGLVWRIYRLTGAGSDAEPRLHKILRTAEPAVTLRAGIYIINAAFGRAHLTRRITVKAGSTATEQFVLNAGGLRLRAVLTDGKPPPADAVTYDIFSDERNRFGDRTQVMTGARPGVIVRLNAGIFHIISTYGDANAKVSADLTVEAGKLSEVQVTHGAARVRFKLVTRSGGEALADTRWTLSTPKGALVKQSTGAIPTHIIAAGTYIVGARHGKRLIRRQFEVEAGQDVQVEVVMQ